MGGIDGSATHCESDEAIEFVIDGLAYSVDLTTSTESPTGGSGWCDRSANSAELPSAEMATEAGRVRMQ